MAYSILFYIGLRLASSLNFFKLKWPQLGVALIILSSLVLYFGGLFNLYLSSQILTVATIGSLAAFAIYKKKYSFQITDILIMLILIRCALVSKQLDLQFDDWDEFSHWGIVQKVLKYTDAFSLSPVFDIGASYIQGYSAWLDFLSSQDINQEFTLYCASSGFIWIVFFLSNYLLFKADEEPTRFTAINLILMACALLSLVIRIDNPAYNFFAIYVDFPMAIFFTAALYSLIVEDIVGSFLLLLLSCVLLTLTKHIGFLFSLIAIAQWGLYSFTKKFPKKEILVYASIALLAAVSIKYSWDVHLVYRNIPKYFHESSISLEKVLDLVRNFLDDSTYQLILLKMWYAIRNDFLFLFSSLSVLLISIYRTLKSNKFSFAYLFFYLFSTIAYLGVLSLSYRFIFGTYEGVRIASFERYAYTIFLPWCLFSIAWFLLALKNILLKLSHSKTLCFTFLIIITLVTMKQLSVLAVRDNKPIAGRNELAEIALRASKVVTANQTVFLIHQNSTGLHCLIMKFEMYPIAVTCEAWSVGDKFYPDDVWTANLSVAELESKLSKHDYVLITDDQGSLWAKYGNPFDKHEKGLFKVINIETNKISLVKTSF